MAKLENDRSLKISRKELRNNMPLPEVVLWTKLKASQTGYKFRRQQSIGRYILDFYCPSRKLSIEVDGDSHFNEEGKKYDRIRSAFLSLQGITELRFNNEEIMTNINSVTEKIIQILKTTPTPLLGKEGTANGR